MRIPRPRKPAVAFKRKRSPPPQATKLLRFSAIAAVSFMVALGAVFLPQMFRNQPPVAIIELRLANATRIDVISVTEVLELSKFNATFSQDGNLVAQLPYGLGDGGSILQFVDMNRTGFLDAGDRFDLNLACVSSSAYKFEIWQADAPGRVGFLSWTGCIQANV